MTELLTSTAEYAFNSAVAEHPEFLEAYGPDFLNSYIEQELSRIALLEEVAHRPIQISPNTADSIGLIRIHSGVGSYDAPFKAEDNPRLREDKPWLAWSDRNRILHGVRLVRKIAEVKSGFVVEVPPRFTPEDLETARQQTRQQIAEYGPSIMYSGYPVETELAEEVLVRPESIIPKEKAIIIHGNPRNTVEEAKMMMQAGHLYEGDLEGGKQALIVTHAPHMARVLHAMDKYPYLPDGSIPYLSPVATPLEGVTEFAAMETRGILYYSLLADMASQNVYPHQFLS